MKILFKYTTRSRRSNFLRGYDSIVNNVNSENYHILISIDKDDSTMFPLPELKGNHTIIVGSSKNKIDAINRDVNEFTKLCDWDILVNVSDDMVFTVKGFDEVIRKQFTEDDLYVHFNDGNQKGNVSTMHICDKKYYSRFNSVYNKNYISLWCDVENDEVAKSLGRYKYVGDETIIFNHLHPAWGLANFDAQYIITESFDNIDRQTYLTRKANGFKND